MPIIIPNTSYYCCLSTAFSVTDSFADTFMRFSCSRISP